MEEVKIIITSPENYRLEANHHPERISPYARRKHQKESDSVKLNSDNEVSPATSPVTSPRSPSQKAKGSWAKIKRELITSKQKEVNSNYLGEGKSKEDMSPMNPPKSPSVGKKSNYDHMNSSSMINCNERNRTMKLLVLGQDGVGKSAFIVRYLTRRFIGEYDPLLEGVFRKIVTLNKQEINIEIKDTCKGVNWPKRTNDLIWADALIFIYSITCRNSFLEIQKLSKLIEQQKKSRGIPCLIIGNKKDLSHERTVTFLEGNKLAAIVYGTFCELSVSDNYIDLEAVVNHFIKEHCQGYTYPTSQLKMLSSRSSPEIRQKHRMDQSYLQPDVAKELQKVIEGEEKTERKGRALWQKLLTSNDLKKSKK